ncbi:hypothetical protein GWI33_015951 [Rhynchophorus ferrugineus]|uniref:Uncharacterized protein n=1 Tax=Rhynchophorus ferrugineus TaxID=354439 RepID=A0A834HYV3_RHYFE|nr:hypothetical protein GWI33_015951 [Rhynchophorus ferrugineus]
MFYLSSTEPTNNVPPKKDGKKFEGWELLLVPGGGTAWLTCQFARSTFKRGFLVLEPTNNVAPKSSGKKYAGGLFQDSPCGNDTIMTCDVSAYPVPKFREKIQLKQKLGLMPTLPQENQPSWIEPTNNVVPKSSVRKYGGNIFQEVPLESDIIMPCEVSGFPVPKYRWYKFIEGTSRKQAVTLDDRVKQVAGTLIIREAKVDDSGKYLCVVNNSVGGESVETVLTVTAPLKANIEPKVQTIDFGRPAVFTCKFEGNPIKTISWMKDGNKIDHTDAVLKIDAVRKEDKGMYQCFIRNDQESAEATAELKLGGRFEPPQIRHAFNEETVQPGNSVFLKCIASGNPTPEITWELYGRRLSNSDRYQIGQYVTVNGDVVSHLNVTGIHTNDGGLYRCVASSKVGSADHSARINVYGLPFVRSMEKQSIVAGGTLIVHCPFAGHPVDTVVWERDGRLLPINRKQKVFPNGTLIIENVERISDQATYVCVAKNSQGYNARGSLEVQVMVPPQIHPFDFGDESIYQGELITATCTVSKGDFPINITWLLNDRPIDQTYGISAVKTNKRVSQLTIESAEAIHTGDYSCIAENSAGVSKHSAYLNINVPPQIVPFDFGEESINSGDSASTMCSIMKGDLPINISWLHNNISIGYIDGVLITKAGKKASTITIDSVNEQHAGTFICQVENKAGVARYSTVLNVNVTPQINPFDFGDEPVNYGDSTSIVCSINKGDLPVKFSWLHNNISIDYIDGIVSTAVGKKANTITIDPIQGQHAGTYTCLAENKAGLVEYSSDLHVNVPPQIVPFDFGEESINSGDLASLTCSVHKGDLPINISWLHNNVSIGYMEGIMISKAGKKISTVSIDSVDESHAGTYTCLAENKAGSASYSAILHVNVPPQILPFDFGEESVNSGDVASLTCTVHKGDLPINISWLHNNLSIGYMEGIMVTKAGKKISTVSIDSVEETHAGTYTCLAENKAGSAQYSALLHVNVPPQISPFDFGDDPINSGDSTSLTCSVHKGDLPINIFWLHNNVSIGYMDGVMITKAGKKVSTLTIDSVQELHAGIYTCLAENKAGVSRYSTVLNVNVIPHINPFDFGEEPVNSGDSASLNCLVTKGDLPINISWLHNNVSIEYMDGIMTNKLGNKVSALTIESVQENHSGLYTCIAENKAGVSQYSASLYVNVSPQILPFDFGEESINSGEVASLTCSVYKGDLPINISWLHNNVSIGYMDGIMTNKLGNKVSALTIESVQENHSGLYTCIAKNNAGISHYSAYLNVNVPPQILPFDFGEESVNTGEFASLSCSAHKGDLPINISWLHNNVSIGYMDGIMTSKVGSKVSALTIDSVQENHAGLYTCIAENKAGVSQYSVSLNVNAPPQILPFDFGEESINSGELASLTCSVHKGDLPINISWLHNNATIGYMDGILTSKVVPPQMLPFDFGEESVNSGDLASLTCSIHKGDLPINISWLHNNVTIGYIDGVSVIQVNKKVSTVTIDSVQEQHRGEYTCLAENKAGSVQYTAVLNVNVPPMILPFTFGEESVNYGDLASLSCSVHKGDLPINISWYHNNRSISMSAQGISIFQNGRKVSSLTIDSVGSEHSGEYICIAQNLAALCVDDTRSVLTLLSPLVPPQISPFDFGDEPINSGDYASVQCSVHKGDLPINIAWLHNNISIGYVDGVQVTKVGRKASSITIDAVTETHSGTYTCLVENSAGKASYLTELLVNVPPQILPFDFRDVSVNAGDVASTICSIHKGDLPLNITWFHNNQLVGDDDGIFVQLRKKVSTITIDDVNEKHSGYYTCIAQNQAGFDQYTTQLHVNGIVNFKPVPPQILPFDFGEASVNAGDVASTMCTVHKGDLPVNVTWLHNNRPIQSDDSIFIQLRKKVSSITIDDVTDNHAGNYSCIAQNTAGTDTFTAELRVNVIPQILPFDFGVDSVNSGDSASLSCSILKGDLPIDILWYHNGKLIRSESQGIVIAKVGKKLSTLSIDSVDAVNSGSYECVAKNTAGRSSLSTELHVNGDSTQIQCYVNKGDIPFTFTWKLNDQPVDEFADINVGLFGKKTSVLSIDSVKEYHAGNYTCQVSNPAGSDRHTAQLVVKVLPKIHPFSFGDEPSSTGETVTVQCTISTGDLPVVFSWMLNGRAIVQNDNVNIAGFGKKVSVLNIDSISETEAGNYTCIATNKAGINSFSAELIVKALPKIQPFDFGEDPPYAGETVSAQCIIASGDVPIDFSWMLNGEPVHRFDDITVSSVGKKISILSIDSVSKNHVGNYTCIATNKAGLSSDTAALVVKALPKIQPFDFGEELPHEGEMVSVQCFVASGDMPIDFSWMLNGEPIHKFDDITISSVGKKISILSIDSVSKRHVGNYTCIATNRAGFFSYTAPLAVKALPKIQTFDFGEEAPYEGESVSVQCFVGSGDMPIDISWMLNGEPVNKFNDISVSSVGKKLSILSIDSVGKKHVGNYTCLATNKAGLSSYTTRLAVKVAPKLQLFTFGDEPIYMGESTTVNCNLAQGDLPINFSWMLNGRPVDQVDGINVGSFGKKTSVLGVDSLTDAHAGNYTCIASNLAGTSSYTAELLVNVPPQIAPFDFGESPLNSGDFLQVVCTVREGDLPIKIDWVLNNRALDSSMDVSITPAGRRASMLMIESVTHMHAGSYSCLAENEAGKTKYTVELRVNVPPQIVPFDFGDLPFNAGESLQVICTIKEGDLPIKFHWTLNDNPLVTRDSSDIFISSLGRRGSTLSIESMTHSHAGLYTCFAENFAGEASFSSQLKVNVPPQIAPFDFGEVPLNAGEFFQVACTVKEGDLPIKIYWTLNDKVLNESDEISISATGRRGSTLSIESIAHSHVGIYTCLAQNSAGNSSYSSFLHINVSPQIAPFDFGDNPLNVGEILQVICTVKEGDLPLNIRWMFNGKLLDESEEISMLPLGRRVPPQIVPFDFGDSPLSEGDFFQVTCTVKEGDLPINIHWTLNDNIINESEAVSISPAGRRGSTISIESVNHGYVGTYTCIAENSAGTARYSSELNVNVPPQVSPFDFGDVPLNAGEFLEVFCTVKEGDLPVKIYWEYDGKSIQNAGYVSISSVGKRSSSLSIESLSYSHVGTYTCLAENKAGKMSYSAELTINVLPQIIPFEFGDEPVYVGQSVQVQCFVSEGDLPLQITWQLNGEDFDDRLELTSIPVGKRSSILMFESMTASHAGNYTCRASNAAGSSSFSSELQVNVPPQIIPFDFGEEPVNSGDVVSVSCVVTKGDLPLGLKWTFKGKSIGLVEDVNVVRTGKRIMQLNIDSVNENHSGEYVCAAKNTAGVSRQSAYLKVNVSPRITPFYFEDNPLYEGQYAQVTCLVSEGDLPIDISWKLNGQYTDGFDIITITAMGKRSSILAIESVSYAIAGNYSCEASNVAGQSTYTTELQVNVPPRISPFFFQDNPLHEDSYAQVNCLVTEGDLPLRINWRLNGKYVDNYDEITVSKGGKRRSLLTIESVSYKLAGNYSCEVRNAAGEASYTTELQVNVPPRISPFLFQDNPLHEDSYAQVNCLVTDGDLPLTITWKLNGKYIDSYEEVSVNKGGKRSSFLTIESVSHKLAGNYTCQVRNAAGEASYTTELQVNVPPQVTPFDFGEEPINSGEMVSIFCVVNKGDLPIDIQWTFNGVTIDSLLNVKIIRSSQRISQLTIEDLNHYHSGEYSCTASNGAGLSKHSTLLHVNVPPQITPFDFGEDPVNSGDLVSLFCMVNKGDLPVDIQWKFNETTVGSNVNLKITRTSQRVSQITIEDVTHLHSGAYTCTAKNSAGTTEHSAYLRVNVVPHVAPFNFGETPIYLGHTTQVTCLVSEGDTPLSITWIFNGAPLGLSTNVNTMKVGQKASMLLIDAVSEDNAGNYTCHVSNAAGVAEHSATLNVHVPPRWILEPTDKAFAQGSDAAVECKADGFPKPVVTWKRATGVSPGDYKDFKPNNPDVKVEDGTLMINNIQKTNEGYYLCEAVNGIGSGLSAVILISVQAPPQFEVKFRNQTSRRGDPAVLQCEAKGEKPIGILWNINNKRLEPKGDNRYTIREEILPNGVLSDLSIKRTERSDTAIFTCIATNAFGSDDTNINMIIQEVPEVPYGLKVLDKSGKSVQLSWVSPYDGNSPIKKYLIEYKPSKGSWEKNSERVLIPGEQTEAGIFTLRPATTYHIRIIAENEIGSSDPSDTVTIITAEEIPGGPPTDIRVEADDQHTLIVYWKPPVRDHWNGDIQGYYVGYKLANTDKPYLFETVEFPREEEGKEHKLKISSLKTYTQYSVVVQAFNKVGAGPTSEEYKANTAEGVPEQPPDKATCTTLTAQTIRVSWVSPPLTSANGIIKGYKVIYGPSDTWFDENTKDTKITASSETILHGLKKYTNYSMEVLSYTSGGDGVRTTPIACQTEQDVPESPTAVKALVMSSDAILVSWKPPTEPNGIIEYYMVYYKVAGDADEKLIKSQKIVPNLRNQNLSFQAKNLDSNLKYEFWVTAATTIGEGQPSKKVTVSPSTSVPAKTASFDDSFTTTYKEDVTLPCLAVGVPPPVITWSIKGVKFNGNANDRVRQQPDGSLFIRDVTRTDAGEYSCKVENDFGQDSVTHQLIVNAPPRAPQVTLTSTTTNSLTIKIKPHESDGEQVHGYTIHYKPEFGEWETVQVGPATDKYTLEKLLCGTRYQLYVTGYNSIGTGDPSDNLNPKTRGEKPVIPSADKFIEVSSNSITLHLSAWSDGGCPMLYFVIEHKKKVNPEWIQVSNNVKPGHNFVLLDLDPAVWYHLRVTAHNNAGFNVAEYEFATLTVTGGTIAPARDLPGVRMLFPWIPDWVEWNIAVPVAATVVVVVVGIVVVCVALSRKAHGPLQTRLRSDYDVVYNQSCNAASTLDKRRPDLRDELGYIAPPNRKLPPVPGSNYNTCDRIKRGTALRAHYRSHSTWDPRQRHLYEELRSRRGSNDTIHTHRGMDDEICPYATFHLLGFREEMDPSKAMQFQTFPHPHAGTMGPSGMNTPHQMHSRNGSQSMPRQNRRYDRVGSQGNGSIYSPGPEYDDPANCAPEDEQYGSQYGGYGAPYDQYGSRGSIGRRSLGKYFRNPTKNVLPPTTQVPTTPFDSGSLRIPPTSSSPEPPPPPPRNHDPSFNDSKDSNEISEAECDRDQLINSRTYGVMRGNAKDGMSHEEMRKLIERNETGQAPATNRGLTTYDTVAV